MKYLVILITIVLLGGCGGNQTAKPETSKNTTATTETASKAVEETSADPYAAMEAERNAVKQSLAGKVSEIPEMGENAKQKVYSGVVEIAGKGSTEQTIVLKTNRGSFVLVGDKTDELIANEGKFLTVMGKPTRGNPVPTELKDLEQVDVEGIVRLKTNK